jgi:hypothetical protein
MPLEYLTRLLYPHFLQQDLKQPFTKTIILLIVLMQLLLKP